jgi:hypothetical protein
MKAGTTTYTDIRRRAIQCARNSSVPLADLFSGNPNQLLPTNRKKVSAQQNASLLIVQLRM